MDSVETRSTRYFIALREAPIEVYYESFGTYHEIYGHYLIVRSIKKANFCIYIRTTVGHISLYREIEEAIQGFCQACSDNTLYLIRGI